MTIPNQREQAPSERILLEVSNNPDVALLEVVLDELNRLNREMLVLKREVATLKGSQKV